MKEITEFKFISLDLISPDSDINESKDEVNEFIGEIREKGLIRPLIAVSYTHLRAHETDS